ncbi:MAG TPA: amidohydrolase family protein [Micropepsaceae bacterium]|nr:amidohydrolase family protein [Micropepsaceae bacterium]
MRKWLKNGIAIAAIAAAVAFTARAQAQQQVLVIQGGTLIDGNGGAPVANSVIIIQGNRITAVGRAGAVQVPAGATVINATGKWITPGLIDSMSFGTWMFGEAYLHFGITSTVPNVGRGDQGLAERDAINHGMYDGPRVFTPVATYGGRILKTPDEARARAKALIAMGADVIGAQDGDAPPEVFAAYADEAHKAGKAAVFRCVGPQTRAKSCVLAGADVMLHTGLVGVEMNRDQAKWQSYVGLPPDVYCDMDPAKEKDMVAFLASHNAAVVPNLIAADHGFPSSWQRIREEDRELLSDPVLLSYYPAYAIADLIDNNKNPEEELTPTQISIRACGYKNHAKFIGDLIAAGGHALPSMDDSQSAPGLGVLQEMSAFQEDAHVAPMKIIQSATKWPAQHFHLKDLGTIEAGKLADIDIVTADPTVDIMNMRKIDMVIKDGHVVDRAFHPWYRGAMFANDTVSYDGAPVSNLPFVNALKQLVPKPVTMPKPYMTVIAPNGQEDGIFPGVAYVRKGPGLGAVPDYVISPTPGIDGIAPRTVLQGTGQTTVTLTGINFAKRSVAYVNGEAVPTIVDSATKLHFALPPEKFVTAGKLHIVVKNPQPVENYQWGDTSNTAHILVPYAFSTELARPAAVAQE